MRSQKANELHYDIMNIEESPSQIAFCIRPKTTTTYDYHHHKASNSNPAEHLEFFKHWLSVRQIHAPQIHKKTKTFFFFFSSMYYVHCKENIIKKFFVLFIRICTAFAHHARDQEKFQTFHLFKIHGKWQYIRIFWQNFTNIDNICNIHIFFTSKNSQKFAISTNIDSIYKHRKYSHFMWVSEAPGRNSCLHIYCIYIYFSLDCPYCNQLYSIQIFVHWKIHRFF